ncbi:hypothetical protein ACFWJ5_21165 [Streptomyces qaidamensis]|uniref:hypothetical protein n=1 Tax=Streptomyces qaidamensis TaxID=1783515 RepID=UPI0036589E49
MLGDGGEGVAEGLGVADAGEDGEQLVDALARPAVPAAYLGEGLLDGEQVGAHVGDVLDDAPGRSAYLADGGGVHVGNGLVRAEVVGPVLLGALLGLDDRGVGGLAVLGEGLCSAGHGAAVLVGEAHLFAYVLAE